MLVCLGSAIAVYMDVMAGHHFNGALYTWMVSGNAKFEIGFLIDPLSATMMIVVSFVSLMVHIYTIGYMADDPGYKRFFSYISLFTFSMLMLVMSNNFLQLFFGWEAVGLVSYLLIGFWYARPTAIYANLKAFLVNRVGDFGFLLGIALVLMYFGTLDYATVFANAKNVASNSIEIIPGWGWSLMTVICILLFIGAMGKSAQFPLHVWLPDSMEGPTPISALIHAATMVTAGIFMVARMSPLFELSDTALTFVMTIGAITAFFMALIATVQYDIKRVVAYSTLSQLGYMTMALGASAYSAAIFHLFTHAFFKAVLFLGAGSVIIAMHHEQDMRKMGGLRKYLPITYAVVLIGAWANAGFPPFAGFFSKDTIIEAAFGWMRANAPKNSPGVRLCKGSNGEWQEIWRAGEIVGMSDWELASIGDPANDWARCNGFKPVVAGRWDERRLFDYYEEVSGLHIDGKSVDYYRLVYALEMLVVCLHAGLPVRTIVRGRTVMLDGDVVGSPGWGRPVRQIRPAAVARPPTGDPQPAGHEPS